MDRDRVHQHAEAFKVLRQVRGLTCWSGTAALVLSTVITTGLLTLSSQGLAQEFPKEPSASSLGGLLVPIPQILSSVAFTTQKSPNPITAACVDPAVKQTAQAGWVRGYGGEHRTDLSGPQTIGGRPAGRLVAENRTTFKTVQGGIDAVFCQLDHIGGNLHVGGTLGHTWGDSDQTNVPKGSETDLEFETFFIGPYAAYTRGDLAVLAAVRFDDHSLVVSSPSLSPGDVDIDGKSVSGSATLSHDFPVDTFILTPEIGMNVSRTSLDSFSMGGGTVHLDNLWSALGHFGVTGRRTVPISETAFVVPFVSVTGYHEFASKTESRFVFGGTTLRVEPTRIGTFGEVGAGANFIMIGDVSAGEPTYFSGARVDVQFGDRLEGFTATVFARVQF